jgi:hypothetical protein
MISWALDTDWDSYLDANGVIAIVTDTEQVRLNVSTALKLWYGEPDFDVTKGVPYNSILGTNITDDVVRGYLSAAILGVVGVQEIISMAFIRDVNRLESVNARIKLINGATIDVNQ